MTIGKSLTSTLRSCQWLLCSLSLAKSSSLTMCKLELMVFKARTSMFLVSISFFLCCFCSCCFSFIDFYSLWFYNTPVSASNPFCFYRIMGSGDGEDQAMKWAYTNFWYIRYLSCFMDRVDDFVSVVWSNINIKFDIEPDRSHYITL